MSDIAAHILIVDDDTRIRDLLAHFLQENGYFVSTAKDTANARQKLQEYEFDLLILDLMLPDESGQDLTKYIRTYNSVPIIMLTAMGAAEDRISGLSIGADDYLPKPFEPRELLLRIKNILNRTQNFYNSHNIFKFGSFSLDKRNGQLTQDSAIIPLTSNETGLLTILCNNLGQVVPREKFVTIAGGINERSIDVQITRLRNKIEVDPKNPIHLKTIRSKGYILYGIVN